MDGVFHTVSPGLVRPLHRGRGDRDRVTDVS